MDVRNIVDKYKNLANEAIIADPETKKSNFSILLVNIEHDLNLGNIVRSANCFSVKEVILFGRKHYDRRGCVGTYKYLKVRNIKTLDELRTILPEYYKVIGVENNSRRPYPLQYCSWDKNKNYLFVFGQESSGIPFDILELCDFYVEIEQYGSVRSLNLVTAAGILMYDFCCKTRQ